MTLNQNALDQHFSVPNIRRIVDELHLTGSRSFRTQPNSVDDISSIVSRKVLGGAYRFTPYTEFLKLKGRDKFPRAIAVASPRDQVVLRLLKDVLHEYFPEAVPRELPNARVRNLARKLPVLFQRDIVAIRRDVQNFYDSLNQNRVLQLISTRIPDRRVADLVRRAIRTPSLPKGQSRSSVLQVNARGVPQGLAISNILANIYMIDFDHEISIVGSVYERYVDDILLMVPSDDAAVASSQVVDRLQAVGLELNTSKNTTLHIQDGFEYLGYSFSNRSVTVRKSSVDRFLKSVVAEFTRFRRGIIAYRQQHPWLTMGLLRQVFVDDLNERITGAISGNKRYGWLFYYSEIDDQALLHRLDRIIASWFSRLPQFNNQPPAELKRLARSYFEIRHNRNGSYIQNYDEMSTTALRLRFLQQRGYLQPSRRYTDAEVDAAFQRVQAFRISSLEQDVGDLS